MKKMTLSQTRRNRVIAKNSQNVFFISIYTYKTNNKSYYVSLLKLFEFFLWLQFREKERQKKKCIG